MAGLVDLERLIGDARLGGAMIRGTRKGSADSAPRSMSRRSRSTGVHGGISATSVRLRSVDVIRRLDRTVRGGIGGALVELIQERSVCVGGDFMGADAESLV